MLVLSRKIGEKIVIDGGITLTVTKIAGNRVTLGIEAPSQVRIVRGELEPIVHQFEKPQDPPAISAPVGTGLPFELPLCDYLPRAAR